MGVLDKKQQVMFVLMLIFFLWHMGTQWTTTLLSFLQWDTDEVRRSYTCKHLQTSGWRCNENRKRNIKVHNHTNNWGEPET